MFGSFTLLDRLSSFVLYFVSGCWVHSCKALFYKGYFLMSHNKSCATINRRPVY